MHMHYGCLFKALVVRLLKQHFPFALLLMQYFQKHGITIGKMTSTAPQQWQQKWDSNRHCYGVIHLMASCQQVNK